ncbi:MAG: TCR/Tet family MFS transporter [Pseudomonadota bacterium]
MQEDTRTGEQSDSAPKSKGGFHATMFVFLTVCIDSIGFGIIIPVLPDLIREVTNLGYSGAALWGGWMSFSYAIMQFVFGPTVGNLSDRYGRRPILLASLAVMAVDYVIMALAPSLLVLFVGRIIAGIAAATYSTCNAYVADVSKPEDRAKNFGLLGAGFGLGFVIGPVIGGLIAEYGTRAPFYAAASLAMLNLCYGAFVLPESLPKERRRSFDWSRANPLGAFNRMRKVPTVAWFLVALFLFDIAHFAYPSVWAYYTKEAFKWSSAEVGLSLAVVGVGFVIVQGWLIRILLPKIGEVRTAYAGFFFNVVSLAILGFITEGWMVYAILPLTALSAILTPALQGLMSNRIPDDEQGELQGAMTSVTAITLIVSPLLMTQLFGHFTGPAAPVYLPGAPFLAASVITALAVIPFIIGLRQSQRT